MPEANLSDTETPYDLTNCDIEPIHILGKVQSYGCLIAVSSDWMITHASANCSGLLGYAAEDLVGTRFVDRFPAETVHFLRSKMQILRHQKGAARVFAYAAFEDERIFDISISQSDHSLIFEFEPRGANSPNKADGSTVQALIARVQRHRSIDEMAREAVRAIKLLSGFDRVMAYRFNEDDSGTVIAEAMEPDQEAFLGLRYPASDIPKQARELYIRSPLRIISDVDGDVYEVYPRLDPHGRPLDLSLAVTRAVSPIHLEYLRNMGVSASMSVSILRNEKLWGLIACHHRTPRYIDYEARSAIELFAQFFNYELAQVELREELAEIDRTRTLHDRLMSQVSGGSNIREVLDVLSDSIKEVIPFDGAAIYSDGIYKATGAAPTKDEFVGLARFLNTTPAGQVYHTKSLVARYGAGEAFSDRVAGILALPISRTPRDYLVLFRREIASSIKWAGNPEKPVETGPEGLSLTPRKSFDLWQQIVRGQSAPWKGSQLRAADALRVTLLEVVLKMADERNAVRKEAQDQQELLIAELNHRVRNILNLIRGLVSQGQEAAQSIDDYRSVLDARIFALARAHDQLTQTQWNWVALRSLLEAEVRAFLSGKASRVRLTGDEIDLSPNAFTTLALVIHELVTNSAKYGALNNSSGSVLIDVSLQDDGTAKLVWRELDGPPVSAPRRRGFGTTIIERSIPFELKGQAEVRYQKTGFEADFIIPAKHVRKSEPRQSSGPMAAVTSVENVQIDGQCLVLEDNIVIALDAADLLTELGASYVHTASSVADAFDILVKHTIDFALLDVNLGDETSLPVIKRCLETGTPIILATGYGASADLVDQFPGVPVLKKPYDSDSLKRAISGVDTST